MPVPGDSVGCRLPPARGGARQVIFSTLLYLPQVPQARVAGPPVAFRESSPLPGHSDNPSPLQLRAPLRGPPPNHVAIAL